MYKPKESKWDVESNNNYEKVTNYIKEKTEKLSKIRRDLSNIKELFKNYVSITKKYCDQIAALALELKPDGKTKEGELTQAIQGILLFNSVSLETLAKELEKIFKIKKNKKDSAITGLEEFSKIYQISLSKLITNYCIYINEIEKYEKYLMNKEMGFDNEDNEKKEEKEKQEKQENNNNEENTLNNKKSGEIKNNNSNNGINKVEKNEPEKLTNNIEIVLEKRKEYIDEIEPMNNLINKLVEFGVNEEKILNEEFFNISKLFVDKLNECLEGQKKKYEDQSLVLADLYNKIQTEQIENLNSGIQQYPLHCLSVYINVKNLIRNKNYSKEEIVKNQKSKDFEIYKDITLSNIENIIKEMKENGLEIREEDMKDLEIEKVKDYIEKKSKLIFAKTDKDFSLEDKNILIDYFREKEEYRSFFLQILNNDRSKGGEFYNMNIYNYFGELFRCINDLILEKNDFRFFKYVSIISMTYFINDGKNKKIYLYEFIKDNEKLKDLEFWKKYLTHVAEEDVKNDISKEDLKDEKNAKIKFQFAAFSNTLTIANNMVNFGFDRTFIDEFVENSKKEFSLTEDQIQQIEGLIVVWLANIDISKATDKETNTGETDPICDDDFEDMK